MTIIRSPVPTSVAPGIQLASAALPAGVQPTPLALGEESPIGLLRPAWRRTTASALSTWPRPTVPAPASQAVDGRRRRDAHRPAAPGRDPVREDARSLDGVRAGPRTAAPAARPVVAVPKPTAAIAVAAPRRRSPGRAGRPGDERRRRRRVGRPAQVRVRRATTPRTPGNGYYGAYQFSLGPGTASGTRACPRPPRPPSRTRPPSSSRPAAAGASGRRAPASSGCS